jgi:hypothetical protein
MKNHSIKRSFIAVATSALLAGPALAAPITGYTLSGSTNLSGEYNADDAAFASITVGADSYSNLIGPTSITNITAPGAVFWGQANAGNPTFNTTNQEAYLLGNTATQLWGGSNAMGFDVFFDIAISDNNAAAPDTQYELFITELTGGDSFLITAITGTQASPGFGSPFSYGTTVIAGQPGIAVRSNTGTDFNQTIGGAAIDISDLGVSEVIGLRVSTTGGDTIAVWAAVPEPSTFALFTGALCLATVIARRRR